MRRNIILIMVVTALSTALWAAPADAQDPQADATLGWISGHWQVTEGDHTIEEVWSHPAGGMLLGYGRTLQDGEVAGFEFLRIATGVDAAYFAQPGGQPPTRFVLTAAGDQTVVFENPDHDFPQRLHYRREGDTLLVTVSDMSGDSSLSWVYQLAD